MYPNLCNEGSNLHYMLLVGSIPLEYGKNEDSKLQILDETKILATQTNLA